MKKDMVATSSKSASPSAASQTAATLKKLLKNTQGDNTTALLEQNDAARLDELRRIFSRLQSTSELRLVNNTTKTSSSSSSSEKKKVQEKWNTWLKKQHSAFISQLSEAVQSGRKSSLRTFLGVIASSPIVSDMEECYQREEDLDNGKKTTEQINLQLLQKLISALILPDNEDGIVPEYMLEMLDVEFISRYRDAQYYILSSIKVIAHQLYDKLDKDRKKGDGEIDEETLGIHSENLVRILIKIDLASEQSELNPLDVKTTDGTCSNYLFLPPSYRETVDESDDDEDSYVNKDDNDSDNENSDDDDDEEKKNSAKNRKNNDGGGQSNKAKNKPKLAPAHSIRQHRNALQEATLTILKLPLLPRTLKLVLQQFPSRILPNTNNPLRFADFCTRAYDMGGVTSLLALNSLFILMVQCGLEYKEFYTSLYNLVEPKIFYAKYRTRFFKLLVKCLSANQMLPAYIIAAFCKKLCRCALNAPPSGALFVLALVSNLLRKHEECACIVHRTGSSEDGGKIHDNFNVDEKEPAKSKAIESSLWELNALEHHYHPAVASMAKGCGMEDSKTLMHNLDEFLLHTYKSLFDQERKRAGNKRKTKTPLTFHKPTGLFVENDVFDGIFDFPNKKQKS